MNHMMLMGHLGADPDERVIADGTKVTTLVVADNQRSGGVEHTVWWRVTLWGDRGKNMLPHLKKGSGVVVWGRVLDDKPYQNKNGEYKSAHKLVAEGISFSPFGRSREEGSGESVASQVGRGGGREDRQGLAPVGSPDQGKAEEGGATGSPYGGYSEDEIPF